MIMYNPLGFICNKKGGTPLRVKKGTKLQIAIDNKNLTSKDFSMLATFQETENETCFYVSIPIKDGNLVTIDEATKLVFKTNDPSNPLIFTGYVDEVIKKGIRHFWKIRKVKEQREFLKRTDERIDSTLHIKYWSPTWQLNEDGDINTEDGLTLNISASGLAMYLNDVFNVGEVCEIAFPKMGRTKNGEAIELVGEVCWNRQPPRGSGYKNLCGIKFNFQNSQTKTKMYDYVENIKKYK